MHPQVLRFVAKVLRRLPPRGKVVEIGALDVNGSVRTLFDGAAYVGLDRRAGRGVDLVADGATWRPPAPVDTVVCCEVLEHAADPAAIVANARAMLEPGGVLILTCATEGRAPHGCLGGPVGWEHYRNVSLEDVQSWLMPWGYREVEYHPERGDLYAWAVK